MNPGWWLKKKIITKILIISTAIEIIAFIIVLRFSHQIIHAMYKNGSLNLMKWIVQNSVTEPVEYYDKYIGEAFYGIIFFLFLFTFVLFALQVNKKIILHGIVISCIVYSIIFIANGTININGVKYFTLFDDAMISMRYAKNLAHGNGLIWNVGGPRVEGYTNFLWTLYMALWHLLPISDAKISLCIQISALILMLGSLYLIYKLANNVSGGNRYVTAGSLFMTAAYLPIHFYALRGMETSVLCFIILLVSWRVCKCLDQKVFDPLILTIMGIGLLTRADFPFLFFGITLFMMIVDSMNWKRYMLIALLIFFITVGGQTLFRWLYYGDILPNTYYLKVTGLPAIFRIMKGIRETAIFVFMITPVLFLLPFTYEFLVKKDLKVRFLLYIFLLQIAYNTYVGGDVWEWWGHFANRYLCIVMPEFFIVLFLMIVFLMQKINHYCANRIRSHSSLGDLSFIIILMLILYQMHGGVWNRSYITIDLLGFHGFEMESDQHMTQVGRKMKEITSPNARIAVVGAGSIPYFSDRYCIDLLGKNDSYLAHLPARIKTYYDFMPGHNKFDYSYSIGKQQPDAIAQLWHHKEEAYKWMDKNYESVVILSDTMYFRKDSPYILWDKIKN